MNDLHSKAITDLLNLANTLATASTMRFMSLEHATSIWKKELAASGLDIPKTVKLEVKKK